MKIALKRKIVSQFKEDLSCVTWIASQLDLETWEVEDALRDFMNGKFSMEPRLKKGHVRAMNSPFTLCIGHTASYRPVLDAVQPKTAKPQSETPRSSWRKKRRKDGHEIATDEPST